MPYDSFSKTMKSHRYSGAIYGVTALVLIYLALRIISSRQAEIDASFRSFPSATSDPDSMLNHANTYYWWGRYRKNTLPEFDSAAVLAERALELAKVRLKTDGDSIAYREREVQARQILTLASQQAEICRFNVASHIPLYMEAMGHDPSYMQEDADNEEVPLIALRGAIGRLNELLSPTRTQTIGSLSNFALVNARTSNPLAEEMLIQELNNGTRMYTISRHEMARILGQDSINIDAVIADSSQMSRLASAFSTDEIALIDFTENDKVDGIYYYGMRLRLWNTSKGLNPHNVYTEYMVRNRVFNQLNGIIMPLFFAFILLAVALNLLINVFADLTSLFRRIHPLYLPICFILATGLQYVMTSYGLVSFLNPAPDDFYVVDAAELWVIVYPLTFLLPALIIYLILGKLDNLIKRFRSDLENPAALFALTAGTLMTVPYVFTYLHAIRFGTQLSSLLILPVQGAVMLVSFFIARHWSAIVNFPERVHPAVRLVTWVAVAAYAYTAFRLPAGFIIRYDISQIREWLIGCFLPTAAVIEAMRWGLNLLLGSLRRKSEFQQVAVQPKGLDAFSVSETDSGPVILDGASGVMAASLYVEAQRGMPASASVEGQLKPDERMELFRIDFSGNPPAGKEVHYHPYAIAFEDKLAYIKFNDAAEIARKTSNLLGRFLSSITSLGGLIVDERSTLPRDPHEVARMLLEVHGQRPCIWLLDHVEQIRDEDMELLKALVVEMRTMRSLPENQQEKANRKKYIPLLILCGYGEYGHRDRIFKTLGSLGDDRQVGMVKYRMEYEDAAMRILEKESLPIQVQLHLENLFRREKKDNVPLLIQQAIGELWKRGSLFRKQGVELPLAKLDELMALPDVNLGISLPKELENSRELVQVLTAAAYLSDGEGCFRLPVVAHVLGIDRLSMLRHLKEAERMNLVYDLKGMEYFYLYAFTDRSLVNGLMELENPRQKEVSQLAKEFYRGFVEYHCLMQDGSLSAERLPAEHDSGRIGTDTLTGLAERAYAVHPAFPLLAFHVNRKVAGILAGNGIARFGDALSSADRAVEIAHGLPSKDKEMVGDDLFELEKLRFGMLLETGGYRNAEMDSLLDTIKANPRFSAQTDEERHSFDLEEARLRFLRFRGEDAKIGESICTRVKAESENEEQRLRAEFYSIKLVPSKLLIYGGDSEWPKKALETEARYRELLRNLDNGYADSHSKKELYRQVLNDYGGSFLTDKVLPLTTGEAMAPGDARIPSFLKALDMEDPVRAIRQIEELLFRRISLETPVGEQAIPKDFDTIIQKLEVLHRNEDPSIDKRGLCYTLNYLSRAYLSMKMFDRSISAGEMAYQFNTLVGDFTGCCLSSGTIAYGYSAQGEYAYACKWFERSFGHGWTIGHWSQGEMAIRMMNTAKHGLDSDGERISAFYLRQVAVKAVLTYFPIGAIGDDIPELLLSSRNSLGQLRFTYRVDPLLGGDPIRFLDGFQRWMMLESPGSNGSGRSNASWTNKAAYDFDWKTGPLKDHGNGISGTKLSITPVGLDNGYDLFLVRDKEESWHIVSMK